jgi:hypothetical protein
MGPDPDWVFLIWAFPYTHRSSGIRALYRLCHHLNVSGYPTAVIAEPGEPLPDWNCFLYDGDVSGSVVVYPEVVSGNPLRADRVVRWVLNTPGLLGGDPTHADSELVFVYDLQRLSEVNGAISEPIGPERELWMGLVDPSVIYPAPHAKRDIDCSFTYKGAELARTIPLPDVGEIQPLESLTSDLSSLGRVLRRTRTLYSYDHYSNVLREAVISGCEVRVPDETGHWHDPRYCGCPRNIRWHPDVATAYVAHFHSSAFVPGFIDQVRTRWSVPDADMQWARGLPFPATRGGQWREKVRRRLGRWRS